MSQKELQKLEECSYVVPEANRDPQQMAEGQENQAAEVANKQAEPQQDLSEVVCSICYSPFENEEKVIYVPKCHHLYHSECILDWFRSHGTCPNCRQDVKQLLKDDDEENNNNLLNRSIFEIADI